MATESAKNETLSRWDAARASSRTTLALNDEGLCARCASVPWEELAVPSPLDDEFIFPIHETLKELELSRCRVCRLFANTVLTHASDFYPGPLNLRVCDTDIFDSDRTRGLFFDNRTSRSCKLPSGDPRYPHLVITTLSPRQAQAQLDHLYPDLIYFRQIRSWLDECDDHHDASCAAASTEGLMGLKVIDCAKRSIVPAPPDCHYVALSYVWGEQDVSSGSCQSRNLERPLPRTIEDTVTVTLELGFRYLWVDRYCINQADDADKDAQIRHMGEIYAAAQVTIVAAASEDSDTGLPGVSPSLRGVRFTGEHIAPVHLMVYPGESPARDILYTRWRSGHNPFQRRLDIVPSNNADTCRTLQEFYLSRRRLVFTKRQVLFVCSSRTARETHPYGKIRGTDFRDMDADEYFQYWMRWMSYPTLDHYTDTRHRRLSKARTIMKTLEASSNRKMSFAGDALHAITGILKLYAKDGVYHIWGAPCFATGNVYAPHLSFGSSWVDSKRPERLVDLAIFMDNFSHGDPCERRVGFPSWSPLGWSTPFQWTGDDGSDPFRTYARHLTADASNISIRSAGRSYKISDLVSLTGPSIEDILFNASPHLEILGRTTTVRLAEPRRNKRGRSVAFALPNDYYAIFHPRWTVEPTDLDLGSNLKGLLLLGAEFMSSVVKHVYGMVLILRDHGDHYEKAGDFHLFEQLPPEHLWERWDEERKVWYGAASSLTDQFDRIAIGGDQVKDTGEIKGVASATVAGNTEEPHVVMPQEEDSTEYWWWKYFTTEETIILG